MCKHIASFSGGKDSTAMLIRMLEIGMHIDDIVFADTGLEFPEMYAYIDMIERYIGRDIIRLENGDWDKWFFGSITRGNNRGMMRGFPLTAYPCWHSREAKVNPLNKYCAGHIRYIGYAIDENSHKRQATIKAYLNGNGKDRYQYPLIDWKWTEDECLEYLRSKGIYNSLYDRFSRLGCWCCPKQGKDALLNIYTYYPNLWENLLWYDSKSRFNPRYSIANLDKEFRAGRVA